MKLGPLRIFGGVFASLAFLSAHSALAGPQGLLIFSETPNYAEACEFSSIKHGPLYSRVERADGTIFDVVGTATMRPVDYPPSDPQLLSNPLAEWNLAEIERLQREFPAFSERLAGIAAKWKNALVIAKITPAPQPGPAEDNRYAGMPRDAFARFGEETPTAPRPAPLRMEKPDPFASFGGNALDNRKGFIGSQSSLERKSATVAAVPVAESKTEEVTSAAEPLPTSSEGRSDESLAELQSYLEKLLAE